MSHDNVLKVIRFDIYNCIQTHIVNHLQKVTRVYHTNLFLSWKQQRHPGDPCKTSMCAQRGGGRAHLIRCSHLCCRHVPSFTLLCSLTSFSTGISCLQPHRSMTITLKSFQVLSYISSLWPPTTKTKTFESFQNFSKFLEMSSSKILWTLCVKIKYFLLLHVNN